MIDNKKFKPDFKFFQEGKIGTWKKFFDKKLSDKFDEAIKTNLKYNSEFYYGDESIPLLESMEQLKI